MNRKKAMIPVLTHTLAFAQGAMLALKLFGSLALSWGIVLSPAIMSMSGGITYFLLSRYIDKK